jgi:hypothetical protein
MIRYRLLECTDIVRRWQGKFIQEKVVIVVEVSQLVDNY